MNAPRAIRRVDWNYASDPICGACNAAYRACHRCDASLKGTEDPKHYPLGTRTVHVCPPCFEGLTRMGA